MVDDIIASADLKRGDFNVRATMKGLVISKGLKVMLKSGERLALSGNTVCSLLSLSNEATMMLGPG